MYKVLIVDDEKMIRMGIKKNPALQDSPPAAGCFQQHNSSPPQCDPARRAFLYNRKVRGLSYYIKKVLPWEELGIRDVYTASTGKEALEILAEYHPEILITDIQMTEMTGLKLIEEAKKSVPELRVIVLTGYDNFEYARQSLRLKVQDFFLKPIEEEELAIAVKNQVEYLNKMKHEEEKRYLHERTQGSALQTKLEYCLRSLIHNREEKGVLLKILQEEYHFDVARPVCLVLIISALYADNLPVEEKLRAMTTKNICMSMVDSRGRGITFTDDDGLIGIVFIEEDEGDMVLEEMEEIADIIKDEFDAKPKVVVGSTVQGFVNLHVSYNDAHYMMENEKENFRDIVQNLGVESRVELFRDTYAELKGIMCANIGNTDYVMKVFNTFSKSTESYNLSKLMTRRCCFEIGASLYFSYIGESGEVEGGKLDALAKGLVFANKEEACEITRMFLLQLLGQGEKNVHEIISKAKYFIDEHLAEDLSVSSIAANLYITPNYFSRLFKRVMKEGCNEYIVRKRIEKAKSLLENTSIKTGKIALMVGYHDTNYFSLAFKKHTGKSPTKYRDEMQGYS